MNEKQKKFIQSYVVNGFNAQQAAREAGYSAASARVDAYKMLEKPHIKPAIERGIAYANHILETELGLTVKRKAEILMEIVNRIVSPENDKPDNYKDAIKAIEQLNKMQGHHMPTRSLSITLDATKEKLLEASKSYSEF